MKRLQCCIKQHNVSVTVGSYWIKLALNTFITNSGIINSNEIFINWLFRGRLNNVLLNETSDTFLLVQVIS